MGELISIIVPVYQAEKYIRQCIDSLLSQTYAEFEILLVDDGSLDSSGYICDEYAQKNSRIKVIHQQNMGVSAARNAGLDMATGDYIGFVDADDWIEPNMYERMHEWIKSEDVQIAICGWILHDEYSGGVNVLSNNDHALLEKQQALYYALRGDSFEGYTWNKLFDSKLFASKKCRFREDIYVCEDLLVTIGCINMAKSVYYCSEPLYHYRAHAGAATRTLTEKSFSELTARQSIIELFSARDQKLLAMSKSVVQCSCYVTLRPYRPYLSHCLEKGNEG